MESFLRQIAAAIQFGCVTLLFVIGPIFWFWITFFTDYWYVSSAYLVWVLVFDRHTSEKGGRTCNIFRRLKLYAYAQKYYPVTLKMAPECELDPKRNYLFCCFPHGVMPIGTLISLASAACGIDDLIPNHTVHILTLHLNFKLPIYRDYLLSLGACSVTPASISFLLDYPNGGKIAALLVGGAAESELSSPGIYKVVIKKRKGFIKVALNSGAPLVPVFAFGEVDLFNVIHKPKSSIVGRFQDWWKSVTGFSLIFFMGRRNFLPFKKPVNVVVGEPIEVEKNANPTQEVVDALHQKFVQQLIHLFETNKYKYIQNAESTTLIIV